MAIRSATHHRSFLLWAAALLLVVVPAAVVHAAPPQRSDIQIVDAFPDVEFSEPVCITSAGDGSDFLYVGEQPGRVRVIKKYRGVGAVPQPRLFLDISAKVYARSQGGLLDLHFHPKRKDLCYVCYLAKHTDPVRKFKLVVEEYTSRGGKADPASARTVIEIPKKTAQHNGGGLGFGPDAMLYIGVGDGNESKNDADELAQNASQFLGKLLRVDPLGRAKGGYSVPKGNPWPNAGNVKPEIWAYGLRNPWRFCWDKRGRMFTCQPGSSGPESREWVTQVVYGGNHGWPYLEGNRRLKAIPPGKKIVPASFEYVRGGGGATCGIGGFVYRGDRCKAIKGKYVFGDYMRGEVYCLDLVDAGGGRIIGRKFEKLGEVPDLAGFGEDQQGEIYMCANEMGVVMTLAPNP